MKEPLRVQREYNGSLLRFSCAVMNRLEGSEEITCNGTSWTNIPPICIRKYYYCIKSSAHVINSRALTGEKPCINNAIHALLMHGYATFNMLIPGHRIAAVTRCVLPCPRTSIVRGNSVRATTVKRRNKIVQDITQNVANVFNFYAIIAIEHGFSMH